MTLSSKNCRDQGNFLTVKIKSIKVSEYVIPLFRTIVLRHRVRHIRVVPARGQYDTCTNAIARVNRTGERDAGEHNAEEGMTLPDCAIDMRRYVNQLLGRLNEVSEVISCDFFSRCNWRRVDGVIYATHFYANANQLA